MSSSIKRRRIVARGTSAAAVAGLLAVGAFGTLSSTAFARVAATSVDSTYLQDTLGLPANTVVEAVTYDRFQWLLQQPGQFAFVIGSASDAGFPEKVVAADAAAKLAGAAKVYWYDPNLTGLSGVQNLNTRVPGGINLAVGSQEIFGRTWQNVLGQYLGNGIRSVPNAGQTSTVISADDAIINDSSNPAWDYRSGQTPSVSTTDDVFFVYDKDNTSAGLPDKIVDWVNLTTNADVPGAIGVTFTAAGGGVVIDQIGQFEWWKASGNRKHDLAYPDDARYGGDILTDSDNVNGWHVQQITYPELLHLLKVHGTDKNFVILFGGTWCHNTRAVLSDINREAHDNGDTTVYNFDLVLDGGTVNGSNGSANPIHVRDNANSGATFNFRPSWAYGDVVRTYFKNLATEYDPNTGSRVAYYPGGDLTAFPDVVRKLQVPFLVNYQRGTGANPSGTSVKRQWIQLNTDPSTGLPTLKEYMSEWWFTHPSPQLGLNFAIPADESSLTAGQQASLAQARANVAFGADAVAKLHAFFGGLPGAVATTQTVTAPSVTSATAATVTLQIDNTFGRTPAGTATLAVNGLNFPVVVSGGTAQFTVPPLPAGTYPLAVTYATDAHILGFTATGQLVVTAAPAAASAPAVRSSPGASRPLQSGAQGGAVAVTVTATPHPSPLATPSPSPSEAPRPSPAATPTPAAHATAPAAAVQAARSPGDTGHGEPGVFTLVAIVGATLGLGGLAFGGYFVSRGR